MSLTLPLLLVVVAVAIAYCGWIVVRHRVKSSPLDILPGPQPVSFFFGAIPIFLKRQGWRRWAEHADAHGRAWLVRGFLHKHILITHDAKALHTIMVKDQHIWQKNMAPSNNFTLLLGPGLLSTGAEQHKRQRKLLNPVFSAAHLREMTHIFYDVAHRMHSAMAKHVLDSGAPQEMDVNGWMGRTTLEMLGQAGLGYSFDDFTGDKTDTYGESLKLFFPALSRTRFYNLVAGRLSWVLPDSAIRSMARLAPWQRVRRVVNIADTIALRSREIVAEKKAALARGDAALKHEVGEGKDIMSICLRANMAAADSEKMTDEELIAQMSTFILAGMDTTSNALSRILWLLAMNPDVQEKLLSTEDS
ncbi:cytochrome P450 [Epithele typhae]|uniref:cytochrome P450 n=1 Tax=Epithele typhae TaxID=378194 RepID=UPI00200811C3|nr:cytochrome P450 [Epithele typhae]KAH9941102.1 cytochrome P450 [Epithele typhae]